MLERPNSTLIVVIVCLVMAVFAPNTSRADLDSLRTVWQDKTKAEEDRFSALQTFAWKGYMFTQTDSAFYYAQILFDEASKTGNKNYMANALNLQGVSLSIQGKDKDAIEYMTKSLHILEEAQLHKKIASTLHNLGNMYYNLGNIEMSLNCFERSLKIEEETGDKRGAAGTWVNLGKIQIEQGNYDIAFDYYNRALAIGKEIKNNRTMATAYNNLADIHKRRNKPEVAIENHQKSLKLMREINDFRGIASSLNGIGSNYFSRKNFKLAEQYYKESLIISDSIDSKLHQCISYVHLAELYIETENYEEGLKRAKQALKHAQEADLVEQTKDASKMLWKINKKLNNPWDALAMHELYIEMRDSVNNEATQKAAIKQQTQYEFEKAQLIKEQQEKEEARLASEAKSRRNNLQYSLIFLSLLLVFGLILSLGYIKISTRFAEGIIFFAFLIFFEFVLVLAEPYVTRYTGGEPIYVLLINSSLAGLIFPIHSFFEEGLKRRIVRQ